jgi:biotin carboxyl carrier protein
MEYDITIGKISKKIELDRLEGTQESYLVGTEGKSQKITVLKRDAVRLLLSMDDKIYSVTQVSRSQSSIEFISNGERVVAQITGSGTKAVESYSAIASVAEVVVANFPAKVVKVNAKPGVSLEEDATLIVLEAMKMEAMIKTPKKCTVVEVYVREGDMVERGKALARLTFS